jgi:hypothetical protein
MYLKGFYRSCGPFIISALMLYGRLAFSASSEEKVDVEAVNTQAKLVASVGELVRFGVLDLMGQVKGLWDQILNNAPFTNYQADESDPDRVPEAEAKALDNKALSERNAAFIKSMGLALETLEHPHAFNGLKYAKTHTDALHQFIRVLDNWNQTLDTFFDSIEPVFKLKATWNAKRAIIDSIHETNWQGHADTMQDIIIRGAFDEAKRALEELERAPKNHVTILKKFAKSVGYKPNTNFRVHWALLNVTIAQHEWKFIMEKFSKDQTLYGISDIEWDAPFIDEMNRVSDAFERSGISESKSISEALIHGNEMVSRNSKDRPHVVRSLFNATLISFDHYLDVLLRMFQPTDVGKIHTFLQASGKNLDSAIVSSLNLAVVLSHSKHAENILLHHVLREGTVIVDSLLYAYPGLEAELEDIKLQLLDARFTLLGASLFRLHQQMKMSYVDFQKVFFTPDAIFCTDEQSGASSDGPTKQLPLCRDLISFEEFRKFILDNTDNIELVCMLAVEEASSSPKVNALRKRLQTNSHDHL